MFFKGLERINRKIVLKKLSVINGDVDIDLAKKIVNHQWPSIDTGTSVDSPQ